MSLLEVRALSKAFGGVRAVSDVSFTIGAGEFLAMIGPNGAGKTTCFNIINGQLAPDSGEILLAGDNIAGLKPRDIWRRGVGRTFQIAATFHSMTVAENVQMALLSHAGDIHRLWRPAAAMHRDRALDLLAQVGMHEAADRPSRELAYGDVKRVEFAIALANEPRLLLMDEPTAGMAARERHGLIELVKRLVVERRDFGAVHRAFDGRGVRLRRPHRRLGARPADRRRRRRVDPRQRPGARGLFRHGQDVRRAWSRLMSEAMLSVQQLSAWYGAARILYDLSFEVGRGEVVALMGRNGAGKSTTMRAIMGLIGERAGTVRFNGDDISRLQAVRDRPPRPRLYAGGPPHLFRSHRHGESRRRPPAAAPFRRRPAGAGLDASKSLFALFPNLAEMPDRLGDRMSGGEQQMLTVARTLMGNPLLVLLDEPSEGVAPLIVEQMAATIVELKKEGLSILLSEQNIHFARLVADRVYVLEQGQIRWQGAMAQLDGNQDVQRAYLTV